MRDPLIRSYDATPPFIPGLDPVRFRWPDRRDPDVRRIRERVQDGGVGLYVLIDPRDPLGKKCLVEAYYPEDIRPEYAKPDRVAIETDYGTEYVTMSDGLNPYQHEDFRTGRLVAVAVIMRYNGELDDKDISDIRKGNANARQSLRRHAPASVRKANMRRKKQEEQDQRDEEFYQIADRFDEEVRNVTRIHSYGGL